MAPRPLEPFSAFAARLRAALRAATTTDGLPRTASGGAAPPEADRASVLACFGGHHYTHAVCLEDGVLRVRRLESTEEEAAAYLARRGFFLPESAEEISKPRTVVFETASVDELLAHLETWTVWP